MMRENMPSDASFNIKNVGNEDQMSALGSAYTDSSHLFPIHFSTLQSTPGDVCDLRTKICNALNSSGIPADVSSVNFVFVLFLF